jgi:hypothetical protein
VGVESEFSDPLWLWPSRTIFAVRYLGLVLCCMTIAMAVVDLDRQQENINQTFSVNLSISQNRRLSSND